MPRTHTASPLVDRDADGSLVPAGRQMAPRQDDRSSYGLTDAEVVAFQYAVDEINGHPSRIDQYVTIAESDAMLAVGIGSAAMDQKAAWLTTYRASHPLPSSYSYLPADDPSLYHEPEPVSVPVSVIAETMHALEQEAKQAEIAAPITPPVTPAPVPPVPQPSPAAIVAALAPSVVAAASGTTTSEKVAAAAVVAVTVMDALEPHVNDTGKSIIDVLRAVFSLFHH